MAKRNPLDIHAETYGKGLRSSVYGFWRGVFSLWEFVDAMAASIEVHFTRAWQDAAGTCGITPDEYSAADQDELRYQIASEIGYVTRFARDIASSAKGLGKLTPLVQRTQEWQNKYYAIYNLSLSRGCAGQKLRWVLGVRKEHCIDCRALNGRVYTVDTWNRYGIMPQSRDLNCSGYNCGCFWITTDEPVTPGHPPALVGHRKMHGSSPTSVDYVQPIGGDLYSHGRLHA